MLMLRRVFVGGSMEKSTCCKSMRMSMAFKGMRRMADPGMGC